MTQEAWQQCPPDATRTAQLGVDMLANTRAALEHFVSGSILEEGIHLKRLAPGEAAVWEIRVIEFPQVRIFGWFGSQDLFLASHVVARHDLGRGARQVTLFRREIDKTTKKRDRKFHDLPFLRSGNIHECVSSGVRDDLGDNEP